MFPEEKSAQDGMACYNLLPGTLECGNTEVSLNGISYLLEIHLRLRGIQTVEEHTLLHGRERIYPLNIWSRRFDFAPGCRLSDPGDESIECVLRQASFGEIGRGVAA